VNGCATSSICAAIRKAVRYLPEVDREVATLEAETAAFLGHKAAIFIPTCDDGESDRAARGRALFFRLLLPGSGGKRSRQRAAASPRQTAPPPSDRLRSSPPDARTATTPSARSPATGVRCPAARAGSLAQFFATAAEAPAARCPRLRARTARPSASSRSSSSGSIVRTIPGRPPITIRSPTSAAVNGGPHLSQCACNGRYTPPLYCTELANLPHPFRRSCSSLDTASGPSSQ
jgi:hypothetical protein